MLILKRVGFLFLKLYLKRKLLIDGNVIPEARSTSCYTSKHIIAKIKQQFEFI